MVMLFLCSFLVGNGKVLVFGFAAMQKVFFGAMISFFVVPMRQVCMVVLFVLFSLIDN